MYGIIRSQGLVPLFYNNDADTCLAIARSLYRGGIRSLEFTNRGPAALDNFKVLAAAVQAEMPELALGAGTIKSALDAERFIEAGASFLISPVFDNEVYDVAYMNKTPWLPGCMTPTEIHTAVKAGCGMIKLFPGSVLQPGFIAAVTPVFPGVEWVVTGGVEPTEAGIETWLKAGAAAVGLGGKFINQQLIQERNFAELENSTAALLRAAVQIIAAR